MNRPPPKKGGASPPQRGGKAKAKGPPRGRKHGEGALKPAAAPKQSGNPPRKRAKKKRSDLKATQQRSVAFLRWAKDIYELLEETREVMVREGGLMKKKTQRAGSVGATEFVATVRGFSFDLQVARTKGITQCPLSKAEVKFALGPILVKLEAAGEVPPKKDDRVRIGDDPEEEIPMISWVGWGRGAVEWGVESGGSLPLLSMPTSLQPLTL